MELRGISTPTALAKEAALAPSGFLKFWRGESKDLRLGSIEKLAGVLGVPVESLTEDARIGQGLPVDALIELSLTLSGEDYDVFQTLGVLHRMTAAEVVEELLGDVARLRERDPRVDDVLDAVTRARARPVRDLENERATAGHLDATEDL